MNKNFKQFTIATICFSVFLFFGLKVEGYTNPTVSAPANNNEFIPIYCDSGDCAQTTGTPTNGVKNGGLSVDTFQARGDAWFDQDVFFGDLIRAGVATDTVPRTINFGNNSNHTVSVVNTGSLTVTSTITSASLQVSSGEESICADSSGTLILCPK